MLSLGKTAKDNLILFGNISISLFSIIDRVAPTNLNILITGKRNTTKELLARYIHENSNNAKDSFIYANSNLLNDISLQKWFYDNFTVHKKASSIKNKYSATIYLDEIDLLNMAGQVKLLEILHNNNSYIIVKGEKFHYNFRVICGSNINLHSEILNKNFREDLFSFISQEKLFLPSLSESKENIPQIARNFFIKYRDQFKKEIFNIHDEVFNIFYNYDWPGGVFELESVIKRAIIFCDDEIITKKHLPSDLLSVNEKIQFGYSMNLNDSLRFYEKLLIDNALEVNKFNKEKAAKSLGISVATLYRRIKELNIKCDHLLQESDDII
ncbi:MAG: sigma 54-interacting transcriptional regulator [Bacteroidetes bacterium]|nr:sigma 54-interacting transcriptional regulator [Bacteroidota bacterium]MBU2586207.1 sigma 54-interacting transcriptional regulator [Bacteroidota bacterium]